MTLFVDIVLTMKQLTVLLVSNARCSPLFNTSTIYVNFVCKLIVICFKIDGQEKNLPVNNKTDWPKIPQVPVMSNISNANTFNNVNSNTPFNDMAYKLDQVLGN